MKFPDPFLQYCATLDLTLTSMRKGVLYTLWCATKPLKAYEILDNLSRINVQAQPPSIYRALDFFVAHTIVHKIESIQSYALCCASEKQLKSEMIMVCSDCHTIIEVHDIAVEHLVLKIAELHHFQLKQDIIELKGTCRECGLS